jgi:hypothetical protein
MMSSWVTCLSIPSPEDIYFLRFRPYRLYSGLNFPTSVMILSARRCARLRTSSQPMRVLDVAASSGKQGSNFLRNLRNPGYSRFLMQIFWAAAP